MASFSPQIDQVYEAKVTAVSHVGGPIRIKIAALEADARVFIWGVNPPAEPQEASGPHPEVQAILTNSVQFEGRELMRQNLIGKQVGNKNDYF